MSARRSNEKDPIRRAIREIRLDAQAARIHKESGGVYGWPARDADAILSEVKAATKAIRTDADAWALRGLIEDAINGEVELTVEEEQPHDEAGSPPVDFLSLVS